MGTKEELLEKKQRLEDEISALYKKKALIESELEAIKLAEWQSAVDKLNEQFGVVFEKHKEFIVTPAIEAYAKEHKFGEGYYPSWVKGQKAHITSIYPFEQIRAVCDTGHTYKQGIGVNEEQRNKRIKLMSLDTPFPIELIAEALNAK